MPQTLDISADQPPIDRNFNHRRQADLDYRNLAHTKPSPWYTARRRRINHRLIPLKGIASLAIVQEQKQAARIEGVPGQTGILHHS